MAFNYQPATIQQPRLDFTQGMQEQDQQGGGLGGITQLLGGLQGLQGAKSQAVPAPAPAGQPSPGFGLGQDLVSPSEEAGVAQYAQPQQQEPSMGGGFLDALQSIMLGGSSSGIGDIAKSSGSPGLGAIGGLASSNPILSSLTSGGLPGALSKTIGGKLGGLF